MGLWQQTRLLLWKNGLLKRRHLYSSLSEVLLPLAFVLLVVWLQTLDPDKHVEEQHYTCPRRSPLSPTLLFPTDPDEHKEFIMELDTDGMGPGIMTVPPLAYLTMVASKLQYAIALAPAKAGDPEQLAWLRRLQGGLDEWTADFELNEGWRAVSNLTRHKFGFSFCRFASISKVYESAEEMNKYVQSKAYGSTHWPAGQACPDAGTLDKPKLHMAVVINKVGTKDSKWDYTIQTNMSVVPLTWPQLGYTDEIVSGVNERYLDQYMMSGFLTMQQAVDRFIIDKRVESTGREAGLIRDLALRQVCDTVAPLISSLGDLVRDRRTPARALPKGVNCTRVLGLLAQSKLLNLSLAPLTEPVAHLPNDVRMTEFPTPEYTDRPFYAKIKDVFALDLILTFLWPISRLIRGIVHEKETRQREGMRMMGLRYDALYYSWLLTYGAIFLVTSLCITGITSRGLFSRSDSTLVFLYFFLFSISIIGYCFVVSVLFNRAKTASTAGVVLFFMGFFAYFGVNSSNATADSKLYASVLSPTAFGIGASILATYEGAGSGVTWSNVYKVPNATQISFGTVLAALFLDSLLYMFMAFYLDAVLPHEFGVRKPYNFLCTRRFWFGESRQAAASRRQQSAAELDTEERAARRRAADAFLEDPSADLRQLEAEDRCVRLRGLSKTFPSSGGGAKVAVDGLDLTMYEGQIFVLLGHNGAGKSTTIAMLTGLLDSTAGHASMYGMDIADDMDAIRHTLGVCPQHDVLFPELTVREHLEFFARLKNVDDVEAEISKQVEQVGLTEKLEVRSANLSGGQKRKLSVCIALLGDSKIVFLDEPTSGMDPYSRRSTWNMLQNNRAGRVMVLTTHFMDEADLLGDRIAIMAEGHLRCCGSSLFLKGAFGIGYTLSFGLQVASSHQIEDAQRQVENRKEIAAKVTQYVPQAKLLSSVGAEVAFKVPLQASSSFPKLFREVDADRAAFGIANYGVSVTTLEEVFLKVASDEYHLTKPPPQANGEDGATAQAAPDAHNAFRAGLASSGQLSAADVKRMHVGNVRISETSKFGVHVRALFIKRLHNAKRDRKSLCCNTLLPVILLFLGLALMKAFPLKPSPDLVLDVAHFEQPATYFPFNVSAGGAEADLGRRLAFGPDLRPIDAAIPLGLNNSCPLDPKVTDIPDGSDMRGLSQWLLEHQHDNATTLYGAAQYQRLDLDRAVQVTVMSNSSAKHGPGIFLNMLDQALAREGAAGAEIRVSSHPFPFTAGFVDLLDTFGSIDASMSIVIAFSFVPASVAIFVVKEREIRAKHQQLISGASVGAYWVATLLWDVCMYLVPWSLSLLCVWGFNIPAFQGENLGATAVLFLMYGLAVAPFTYCLSFLFNSHSTAQNVVLLLNFITGLVLLIASVVMSVIESTVETNRALKYIYRLFPGFCLGNGLLGLTASQGKKQFLPADMTDASPFAWDVIGAELTYLGATAVLYFTLAVSIDVALSKPWVRVKADAVSPSSRGSHADATGDEQIDDEDVAAERDRIDAGEDNGDVIVLQHLRKQFPGGKLAVRGLSFGIPEGECFGFLGVNGAGKTTSLKMLTGDVLPSAGTARLVGHDIMREQSELRRLIGYCPQFDALLEHLTVREHLVLYARIKCIPEELVGAVADEKIVELNLSDFAHVPSGSLSGGNKRKLSVAIAMVGAPPLIFCDEPTTGMDPFNRRFLWDVIARIASEEDGGRRGTVVLTSHSMEECEALCSKVGILVGGQFRCFGSIQHLKSRFGQGLMVGVKIASPDATDLEPLLAKAAHYMDAQAQTIPAEQMRQVCEAWGRPERFETVTMAGSILQLMLAKSSRVEAHYFAEWWLVEDRFEALDEYFVDTFSGCALLERHDAQVRYKLPPQPLAETFEALESAKARLCIAQYAVSDTSLEQIFNAFSARQQEERGVPRGIVVE